MTSPLLPQISGPTKCADRFLWIDDELRADDPLVRLLALGGCSNDCAATAEKGLHHGLPTAYTVVLLDLALPDLPGLAVLERLRTCLPDLPVIVVVTGYAHLFDEALGHKLGALGILQNLVDADDLKRLLTNVKAGRSPGQLTLPADGPHADLMRYRDLIPALSMGTVRIECGRRCSSPGQHLLHLLLSAVAAPELSLWQFMVTAEALRMAWGIECGAVATTYITSAIDAAVRPQPALSRPVASALSTIQSARRIGADDRVGRFALARLLRAQTGYSRMEWRMASRVQIATGEIAHSETQISQIGYGVGYAVPPQLNRDFRRLLGLAPRAFRRACRHFLAACFVGGVLTVPACSDSASPVAPSPADRNIAVAGTVTDRLSRSSVGGSTITFSGPVSASAQVTNGGAYEVRGLAAGEYAVAISGPAHVPHETQRVSIVRSTDLPFSVIAWSTTHSGAVYDEAFVKFFHQVARVGRGTGALRKWIIPPTELYLVEGTVPAAQFDMVAAELRRVNQEAVPALWCGWIGPLPIITGPDSAATVDGRIIVRPNWSDGASGTLGATEIRSGRVNVNVFGSTNNRLLEADLVRGILAHELFHVAGAFHLCGGSVGENPFGFSPTNCPYPDSLMANLGPQLTSPSPQDRLASCLVYDPGTAPGNLYLDINPSYQRR